MNHPLRTPHLAAAGLIVALGGGAHAAVIASTDFDAAAPGTYGTQSGDVATSIDGLAVASDTAAGSVLAVTSGTDRAAQLTDNNTGFVSPGAPALSTSFGGVSTDATGDNVITASFSLIRNAPSAGNPLFEFYLNDDGGLNPSGGDRAAQIRVASNTGSFLYFDGLAAVDSGFDLVAGTEYLVDIVLDLSSTTQDSYSVRVADASAPGTALVNVAGLDSAVADVLPDTVVFRAGGNGGAAASNVVFELDDISINAVPEPGAVTLGALGGLVAMRRRRANA